MARFSAGPASPLRCINTESFDGDTSNRAPIFFLDSVMPTADEINEAIADNLSRPKESQAGSHRVVEHSLSEQVKAAKHLGATTAASATSRGLIFNKISSPGAA